MYLVMDFVPNHSSDQHPWFQKSLHNLEPYSDYYVWLPRNSSGYPVNNWVSAIPPIFILMIITPPILQLSAFGNSSWEYRSERDLTYYHRYLVAQPDLNYRNPNVRQEMINALRFWMQKGDSGSGMDELDKDGRIG